MFLIDSTLPIFALEEKDLGPKTKQMRCQEHYVQQLFLISVGQITSLCSGRGILEP